jgi:hypothetical protein
MHRYPKSTAAAIYRGDLVVLPTAGKVAVAAAGGVEIVGVAAQYASAADTTVAVYNDPDQHYYIKDDGASATLARTDVGKNADIVATTGDTTFLHSKHVLDTDSATIATAQLRILDFHPDDEVGKYVRCRVVINEHAFAKKLTGI